jgi:hypothetical protein
MMFAIRFYQAVGSISTYSRVIISENNVPTAITDPADCRDDKIFSNAEGEYMDVIST